MNAPGSFIVLDGPDGSGKSTQASRLVAALLERERRVTEVREPGGTPVGEAVRAILLDNRYTEMAVETELLLYMASRAQLVREVIRPALQEGHVVIADRFLVASAVYQGLAGGIPVEKLLEIGRFATIETLPDLTLLYDVPVEVGLSRKTEAPDRMEAKDVAFHERVRQGYLKVADHLPGPVQILDGTRPMEEVFRQTWQAVEAVVGT